MLNIDSLFFAHLKRNRQSNDTFQYHPVIHSANSFFFIVSLHGYIVKIF